MRLIENEEQVDEFEYETEQMKAVSQIFEEDEEWTYLHFAVYHSNQTMFDIFVRNESQHPIFCPNQTELHTASSLCLKLQKPLFLQSCLSFSYDLRELEALFDLSLNNPDMLRPIMRHLNVIPSKDQEVFL